MTGQLYFGDNLPVLRKHLKDETVDLIYLDPPFNSNASYNVLFKTPAGDQSAAQTDAFKDTWRWGDEAETAIDEVKDRNLDAFSLLRSLRGFLHDSDIMAYLSMMSVRLIEMHRALKPTGNLYLHCDPTASHYLKILLDGIFGPHQCVAELIWRRTNARGTTGRWPRVHDVILHYSKTDSFTFHSLKTQADHAKLPHTLITGSDGRKYQTYELTAPGKTKNGESGRPWRGFDPSKFRRHWANSQAQMNEWDQAGLIHWASNNGFPRRRDAQAFDPSQRMVTVGDVWADIDRLNQTAKERLGYPTQKPLALLERIINASSNPGDFVLDPFCGCGTTIHAAEKLGRRWVGIDIEYAAIQIIEDRLKTHLPLARYETFGIPEDEYGARELARRAPRQFEKWAVSRLGGTPRGGTGDRGIDGEIVFKTGRNRYGRAIVSVKGGQNVSPSMIRDLKGTVYREGADIGFFVCLEEPTAEMSYEASTAGRTELPTGKRPKLQILTVRDLVQGPKLGLPPVLDTISAAAEARKQKPMKKAAAPDRKQRHLILPLAGGSSRDAPRGKTMQLPLDDRVAPDPERRSTRRRRHAG
jgi:site-specific DNA-methyltransferase (adenine-specific)